LTVDKLATVATVPCACVVTVRILFVYPEPLTTSVAVPVTLSINVKTAPVPLIVNADAVQEETIVFYGNVKPLIDTVLDDDVTTEADF
jgi:hypothetical protein